MESPRRLPMTAVVAGGDPSARQVVTNLLREAGFGVEPLAQFPVPALVLLLLSDHTEAKRVGEVRAWLQANPRASVLAVMPVHAAHASLRRVLLAGAAGIVLDDDLDRTLAPTARAILAGQLTVPQSLARQVAPQPLSYREKQIVALVMRGRTNREIADELYLAESTVKTHLSSAFRKLDARSRAEVVNRITDPESGYGPSILELVDDPHTARR